MNPVKNTVENIELNQSPQPTNQIKPWTSTVSSYGSRYDISFSQGQFVAQVMEEVVNSLAPLYKKVWSYIWNDGSFMQRMRRPYRFYDLDEGYAEEYIPIAPCLTRNMQYHRVAVRVITRVTKKAVNEAVRDMLKPRVTPVGRVTGQTLVVVAPFGSKPIVRGGYVDRRRRIFRIVVVDRVAERAVHRVIRLIKEFLVKRFKRWVESLRLEPWMVDEYFRYKESSLLNNIIERYRYSMRAIFRNFAETIEWFERRLRRLAEKIEAMSTYASMIKPLYNISKVVSDALDKLPRSMQPIWRATVKRLYEEIRAELLMQVTLNARGV